MSVKSNWTGHTTQEGELEWQKEELIEFQFKVMYVLYLDYICIYLLYIFIYII